MCIFSMPGKEGGPCYVFFLLVFVGEDFKVALLLLVCIFKQNWS